MDRLEIISCSIGMMAAIGLILLLPVTPVHYMVFGDDNLCDDYPHYTASKPSYCYLTGDNSRYDYELDTCADGYYNSWTDVWHFECATEQEAYDRCMESMPEEYMVKDGDLYKRTIELNPWHVICATKVMDGYPADLDKFIEEQR